MTPAMAARLRRKIDYASAVAISGQGDDPAAARVLLDLCEGARMLMIEAEQANAPIGDLYTAPELERLGIAPLLWKISARGAMEVLARDNANLARQVLATQDAITAAEERTRDLERALAAAQAAALPWWRRLIARWRKPDPAALLLRAFPRGRR